MKFAYRGRVDLPRMGEESVGLERHLKIGHGLMPDEYREKRVLIYDYPVVMPAYSTERSAMAKKIALGRKGQARK